MWGRVGGPEEGEFGPIIFLFADQIYERGKGMAKETRRPFREKNPLKKKALANKNGGTRSYEEFQVFQEIIPVLLIPDNFLFTT